MQGELFRVSAPPCLTSLTDGKAQIQPFALSRPVPLQQMQYEVNQHSPPVADVTERRDDRRKLGQVGHMHDHFTVSAGRCYCRIKAADQVFEGWMRGLFGSLGSDEMRNTIAGFGRGMLD